MCFNPRTHEGCDSSFGGITTKERGFNPRTHEGCDNTSDKLNLAN